MPVVSKKEWGWLGANRPDLLHKWQHEAPVNFSKLPEKKGAFRRAAERRRITQKKGS